ncbi:Zn-dependent hydrolase [Thalassobaculum fulvum]|uniref:Zn-dependent hydrolase n=1 Tax=Thalassobaculum fulvum TaxID=1633335 RepID=A0A919CNG8_9PROT|nr:hydantoinase/carbamoylase family amidase [Thalassobaculum fulvum]GHD44781.1 Zn-dependent hydrolase [Thalassobaculum fulvum]
MPSPDPIAVGRAVDARTDFAAALFETAREASRDVEGVTRPAWSDLDMAAARQVEAAARQLDLETSWDPAGNLLATLPGQDRSARRVLTGSHVDSVPRGGNYDGHAGVLASLTALAAFRDLGWTPPCDITAIAMHGEESVWFGTAYLGSKLACGTLPDGDLDRLRRADTGQTLAECIAGCGFDVAALRAAKPWIDASNTKAFLELHIEQGPLLIDADQPVAIPTAIRGNVRFPDAHCLGRYDHSAACPRAWRQDTALATAELISRLEAWWIEQEQAGVPDTVFTVGKLFTDAAEHAMTKVPGRMDFTLNFGGTTNDFLETSAVRIAELAAEIAARRDVRFELGGRVGSRPTPLDPGLRAALIAAAEAQGMQPQEFATVGHDTAVFAGVGIPGAMVLVRNTNGSHNPHEAMAIEDFMAGTRTMAAAIAAVAG